MTNINTNFMGQLLLLRLSLLQVVSGCRTLMVPSQQPVTQSELPPPIQWNQTSDIHQGSTLIT